MKGKLLGITIACCLALIHFRAQSQSPATTPAPSGGTATAPAPSPTQPTNPNAINDPRVSYPFLTMPGGTPLPIPQNIRRVNPAGVTPGKYAEYQSICRENLYDENTWLFRALKNSPDLKEYVDLIKSGRYKGAENKSLLQRDQLGDLKFAAIQAISLAHQKSYTNSYQALDAVTEPQKRSDEILLATSYIMELQQNLQEAKLLVQDMYKKSKDPALLEDLCRLNALDSHHRDADLSCALGKSKNATNNMIFLWHGISLREREKFKDAEDSFKKSIELKNTEFGHSCLGELYSLEKKYPDALASYQKALEVYPQSIRANLGIALLYFQQRKFEEALTYFIKSCESGMKDKYRFGKAQKELSEQKNPFAERYYLAMQKCAG